MASLKDLDPTYKNGALGSALSATGLDYLINPFVAIGNDVFSYVGNELIKALQPDIDYADRKVNTRGPTTSRRIIYGQARVGGQVIYAQSLGQDDRLLRLVVAFAGHSCEEIGEIYINDELSTSSKLNGLVSIYKQPQTGVNTVLNIHHTQDGRSNYLYDKIAYVYMTFNYDTEVFTSVPNITAIVKGKNTIYDPRTGLSGYTDNAALCMLDFLRVERGIADSLINMQSWSDAADIADEQVAAANGETEPRFTLNGTLVRTGSKLQSLTKMAVNSGIYPAREAGVYSAVPSVYVAPAVDALINETDIIGDISIVTGNGKQDKINTVIGTYIDADTNYEQVEYPSIQTPTWKTEDREVLQQSIDYQLVNSGTQCRRLSKIALEQSRRAITVTFNARYRTLQYTVGTRVKMNYSAFGWSGKVFRVVTRKISPQDGVNLTLIEDDPAIYSWEEGDALATVVPPFLELPNPNIVQKPTALTMVESLYQANTQAAIKARASFAWNNEDASARSFELEGSYEGGQYRSISSFIRGTTFEFDDLQIGSWVFRVRGVNSIGVTSPWATLSKPILGKQAPPSDVTGFNGTVRPFSIELAWDEVPDLDAELYEIRVGLSWDTGTVLQKLSALSWNWETRPTGTERVFIKSIDTSGNYSAEASEAQITILAPKSPAPLSAEVIDNNSALRWVNATTSFSIAKYEVRRGDTFDSSSLVYEVTGTGKQVQETQKGSYTYWVRGIDVNGNAGEPASVTANVDQPPDFVLQSDQNLILGTATTVNMARTISTGVKWDSNSVTWDDNSVTFDESTKTVFVGPANDTETWREHFEKLPGYIKPLTWDSATPTWDSNAETFDQGNQSIRQLALANGYNGYLQPTPATASIEIVKDYLGELSLSRIQLSPDVEILSGSPMATYKIAYSADGISYTETTGLEAIGVNFRYVRVRVEIASQSELDLLRINALRVRLDVKLKTDAGRVNVTQTGGTAVTFNVPFVDIQSLTVSANGTTFRNAIYDFVDTPNPTGFDVYLFDENGNELSSGEVSWNARGV